ncbi:MAG: iron-containing alcohol dehydrogenase [Candidatus Delongbacteria bacterium]|nr:iron-containing alcohol dehydrogenase [Candidatus Delongbacteria bacterium]
MSTLYMPVRCFFGQGCLRDPNPIWTEWPDPVLVMAGKSSAGNGSLQDLTDQLTSAGKAFDVVDDLHPNPSSSQLDQIAQAMASRSVRSLIGLGGGSNLDAAKALSLMIANSIPAEDIFVPEKLKSALPMIAIPTTSGTGSEATPYTVINDDTRQRKAGIGNPLIFPRYAFLDPGYTLTLPAVVTRDTAIDALSHLMEGIYSTQSNPLVIPLIQAGTALILKALPRIEQNPGDRQAREDLMTASLYGGIVIAQTSTTLQHSLGYPLTFHLNISHGLANGMVMPIILEFYGDPVKRQWLEILRHSGLKSLEEFYDWLQERGICFSCPQVSRLDLEGISRTTLNARNTLISPRSITLDDIRDLYRRLAGVCNS